jgi:hypothetical protein
MNAARIQWRPLGQMLVERGLLTPEELEEVLEAQQQSGRPLGQIIVDRKLISGPTLALTLAEQCGIELKTDTGFGTGLWSAIQRRHREENRRRTDLRAVPAPAEPVEPEETLDLSAEAAEDPEDAAGQTQQLERLAEKLADRDARLREMAEHSDEIEAMRAQLAEANARMIELEEALQERQRRVEALEAEEPAHEPEPAVEALAAELADRELDVDERMRQVEAASVELADRARELAEQEQAVVGRQRAILTAAADLEQRRSSLEERERALAEREAERELHGNGTPPSAEVREFAARHVPAPPEPPEAADGHWKLDSLSRLVEESADDFPDRVDEWRYILFYLRNEAYIDGTLPSKFDSLVEESFGELLGIPESLAS